MKLIVAGGRDFNDYVYLANCLDTIGGISEIVSGKARGADKLGEYYAKSRKIPVMPFPAAWKDLKAKPRKIRANDYGQLYNALAGFNRNEKMAGYADALAVFPGGYETQNMIETARKCGLKIYDFQTRKKPSTILVKKGE